MPFPKQLYSLPLLVTLSPRSPLNKERVWAVNGEITIYKCFFVLSFKNNYKIKKCFLLVGQFCRSNLKYCILNSLIISPGWIGREVKAEAIASGLSFCVLVNETRGSSPNHMTNGHLQCRLQSKINLLYQV